MAASNDLCFSGLSLSSSYAITISTPYFDFLPDELFIEIVQRLSQIYRYKCVFKHWLNIISSDNFIKCLIDYNASLPKHPFALFYEHRDNQRFHCAFSDSPLFNSSGFSLDFLPLPIPTWSRTRVCILSWGNGLLLCESYYPSQYIVCNPLTKQWVTLPTPPGITPCTDTGFVCKCTSSGCSFRIVHVPSRHRYNRKLVIYASESRKWTEVGFEKGFLVDYDWAPRNEAITCNGLIHWKNSKGSIFVYDPYNGGSNYKIVRVPSHGSLKNILWTMSKGNINWTIGVCKEHVRYIEWDPNNFFVWVEIGTKSLCKPNGNGGFYGL